MHRGALVQDPTLPEPPSTPWPSGRSMEHDHGMESRADYNASKAGVLGLTVAFSAQVAEKGIRVNALMPGLVESRDFGWSAGEWEAREREYPLGRGMPQDIGEAVRYLVSPAGRWVSGTALQIHGGHQRGGLVWL